LKDTIILAGMAFFAYHGVHDEEAKLGQRFDVDVAVDVDLAPAGASDDYADTVGYDRLHHAVEDVVVRGPRLNLIEALADRIARAVLAEFDRISGVAVTVRKPGAPVPGIFDHVAVTVRRARDRADG
jgi:dihydroneopterin aldolase